MTAAQSPLYPQVYKHFTPATGIGGRDVFIQLVAAIAEASNLGEADIQALLQDGQTLSASAPPTISIVANGKLIQEQAGDLLAALSDNLTPCSIRRWHHRPAVPVTPTSNFWHFPLSLPFAVRPRPVRGRRLFLRLSICRIKANL